MEKNKDRTSRIEIEDANDRHFQLHIDAPTRHQPEQKKVITHEPGREKVNIVGVKIWNILEWFALSALVFMLLFFIVNFQAYAELAKVKIARITNTYEVDPFIEQLVGGDEKKTEQKLLPLQKTTVEKKQIIPELNMAVSPPDERIVIPDINKNVPIVEIGTENLIKRDWNALEAQIQKALQDGVVHYPGTAEPGESGNVVLTGHSSYFVWDPGRFKDVFALLHDVSVGDEVLVYHDQKPYKYVVYDKKVVLPSEIDVLTQAGENRLTLITCTPVGTNLKRLVLLAKPLQA